MPALRGVRDIGRPLLSEQLKSNIISYFNWGMLGIGAFFNIPMSSSGAYGGSLNRLSLSYDPNYELGQVFQGYRQDWVYESGIERAEQPIPISGVYVNGAYVPASGGTFYVNYPHGQVVFNSPLPTNSVVEAAYSYRYYSFTTTDAPWYKELMFNGFRADDPQFLQAASGQWALSADVRRQLPAVVVEIIPRSNTRPGQIGGGSIVQQDIGFRIFAEVEDDRSKMIDILKYQYQTTINLYDKDKLYDLNLFPLDANGNLAPSAVMYPSLINPDGPSAWRKMEFVKFSVEEQKSLLPLFLAFVRATVEINMGEIG